MIGHQVNIKYTTPNEIACKLKDLENDIADIQKQLYQNYYTTKLYGYSYYIPKTKHKLPFIKGILVLKPTGEVVSVAEKIFSDWSIQLDSNILLDNHTLILY